MRVLVVALCLSACGGSRRAEPAIAPADDRATLHAVVESDRYYEIHPAGAVTLVDLGWDVVVGERDRFDLSHALGAKLRAPERQGLFRIAGAWPDVWGATASGPPIGPSAELVRFRGDRWDRVALLARFDVIRGLAPFHGGVLAIVDRHADDALFLAAYDTNATAPAVSIRPEVVRTRADGSVFVLGTRNEVTTAVERWTNGSHAVDELPQAAIASFHVTSTAAYAAGYEPHDSQQIPYFAAFDGQTWTRERPPLPVEIRSIAPLADGSVLALGGSETEVTLARRAPGGTWTRLFVNAPRVVAFRMWATSLDDVWIVARRLDPSDRPSVILHSRSFGAPLRPP